MTRQLTLAIAVSFVVAACSSRTPEQRVVSDAADALGGAAKIRAVRTVVIEGTGTNGNLGQDMTMEATSQTFEITGYRRLIDLTTSRARTEQTRTPNFAYFQGQAPQKQVLGIADRTAYNVAPNGNVTRLSDVVAKDRLAELYHHPLTIVRAALDPAAKLSNVRSAGSERVVDITTADGVTLTLAIDGGTRLPTRVVSMSDNVNLGDVAIETSFAGYQDVSGLKLPSEFTTKTDKYTTSTLRVSRQAIDADVGDLAAPPGAATAAAGPVNVTAEALAPGVWLLAGQSHHSVLIEFADHLMLIEAPQNDARTLAVIARARELVPGKPLTEVVNTHHHFDHSGGLRAAIAEGLTVITHKANAAYVQEAASRAHTIAPDALARNPKPVKITPVDEEMTISDPVCTVQLYHVAGNPHSDALLMAYLPRERLLVEVDAFSPGAAVHPFAANLIENVQQRKLRVDRIVPLHGTVVAYSELLKTQAPSTPS